MADRTETGSDPGLSDPSEGLEWVPLEIVEAAPKRMFRRLTTAERIQKRFQSDGTPPPPAEPDERTASQFPYSIPEVRPLSIGDEVTRRIAEVESAVARSARAVDRSARHVRTIVAQDGRPQTYDD